MGIPQTTKVVNCVTGILKSLECAICLELLQTPVSTGCGHFFCRFCITETLQSSYRKPCPLCQKSFTRRGIQEAAQRLEIIKAAKKLAEAYGQITGVNFFPKESTQKICDENLPVLVAVEDSSNSDEKDKSHNSRKRKSFERSSNNNNRIEPDMPVLSQKHELGTRDTREENCSSADEDPISSNKRVCPAFEESDDDYELPSLDSLLNVDNRSKKYVSEKASKNIIPITNEEITLVSTGTPNLQENSFSHIDEKVKQSFEMKNKKDKKGLVIRRKVHSFVSKQKNSVSMKNRINALKNKTNLSDDSESVKTKAESLETKEMLNHENLLENKELSKENENSDVSSCMKSKRNKRNSKGKRKNIKSDSCLSSSAEEDNLTEKIAAAENYELMIESVQNATLQNARNTEKECYELTEIAITNDDKSKLGFSSANQDLKSDEITDTAISVQPVASPLVEKTILSSKSPGWSRVKKVRKDFRMKKFSKLQVEKNNSSLGSSDEVKLLEETGLCASNTEEKFKKISEPVQMEDDFVLNEKSGTDPKDVISETPLSSQLPQNEKYVCSEDITNKDNTSCSSFEGGICEMVKQSSNDATNVFSKENTEGKNKNDELLSSNHDLEGDNPTTEIISTSTTDDVPPLNVSDDLCRKILPKTVKQTSNTLNLPSGRDSNANMQSLTNGSIDSHEKNTSTLLPVHMKVDYLESQSGLAHEVESFILECDNQADCFQSNLNTDANSSNQIIESENIQNNNVAIIDDSTEMQLVNSREKKKFKPHIGLMAESRVSKISKIAKCKSPESVLQNEDVYYMEHSQQTSQRLGFYDAKNYNFPLSSLLPIAVPNFNPETSGSNSMLKCNKSVIAPWNPIKENSHSEKTKVVKRTCLTLEEIQDFFTKSNTSGRCETICSLPFLSGNYKLHIAVSEETLNVSVLKVVEPDVSNLVQTYVNSVNLQEERTLKPKKTLILSEKCIQTSCNNTPIRSPTVLPSSNASSEAGMPDDESDCIRPPYNPIPYLSKFFSDTESTPQLNDIYDASNIIAKDTTEVIPLQPSRGISPKLTFQIDQTPMNANVPDFSDSCKDNNVVSLEEYVTSKPQKIEETFKLNTSGTANNALCDDIEMVDISSQGSVVNDADSSLLVNISGKSKPNISCLKNDNNVYKKSANYNKLSSDDENLSSKVLDDKSITTQSVQYIKDSDEYDAFASDPDMALANELVAPLKSIAQKMQSNMSDKKETSTNNMDQSNENSKLKKYPSNADDILNYLKENSSTNKNLKSKSSRLSLKQKKNSKFRRIQSYDSDSDDSESTKNNVSVTKSSTKLRSNLETSCSRTKNQDVSCATFQDQSTLNSILSDDVNPSEIVREIEDIDEKIKLLEEKLKQCGHTDLVSKENLKLLKSIRDKEILDSGSSSEDSDDIFSQSIPPTPPTNIDSKFMTQSETR